jgi:LMBR1 domain-containing protein 1
MKPFFFIFGIIFLLFSFLIIISILLTTIDKAVHSSNFCGAKCGFVLAYPEIFNPTDTTLTILSEVNRSRLFIINIGLVFPSGLRSYWINCLLLLLYNALWSDKNWCTLPVD